MVIFHSYVSLPKGTSSYINIIQYHFKEWLMVGSHAAFGKVYSLFESSIVFQVCALAECHISLLRQTFRIRKIGSQVISLRPSTNRCQFPTPRGLIIAVVEMADPLFDPQIVVDDITNSERSHEISLVLLPKYLNFPIRTDWDWEAPKYLRQVSAVESRCTDFGPFRDNFGARNRNITHITWITQNITPKW
jgi:hypothetical protein